MSEEKGHSVRFISTEENKTMSEKEYKNGMKQVERLVTLTKLDYKIPKYESPNVVFVQEEYDLKEALTPTEEERNENE